MTSMSLSLDAAQPASEMSPVAAGTIGADVAVSIRGVSKRFVARRSFREMLRHPFHRAYQQALVDVSCDVQTGEFFGLLGPNGAGKTTLFKTLATLITPDAGSVQVAGHDLGSEPAIVRQLVTPAIADERSLRWRLTARENLRLYAVLYGLTKREVGTRVDELLEAVGLHDTRHKLVGQFSTGMKQRLLIARALIPRPRILLLDEPTRGLDPLLARSFRRFLREEIGRRQGCTVLLATHNAEEAFDLCDRVGILDRGRLLVVGRAAELRERFGHQRYRVWTRTPLHPAFDDLPTAGVERIGVDERSGEDGWAAVELELSGGSGRAADVVRRLVHDGVAIARFERAATSLADLIEHVVEASRKGSYA
jgi:ABC-2 type transport system ATP-binding protein